MFDSRLYLPVSQQVLGMFRIADIILPSSCIQIAVLVMLLGSSYLVWPEASRSPEPGASISHTRPMPRRFYGSVYF